MEGDVPWILVAGVFFVGIFVYVLFMIFLPEWVGITGKTALENESSHRGENGGNGDKGDNGDDGDNGAKRENRETDQGNR